MLNAASKHTRSAANLDWAVVLLDIFCVGGCLPVLLDASLATAADAGTVISHPISLDVAGMMVPLHFT